MHTSVSATLFVAALLCLAAGLPAYASSSDASFSESAVQDNPRVVEPVDEPVDMTTIPENITSRAVEASIHYVKINPEHLLDESLQTKKVDIWLSEDLGYVTVQKFRYRVFSDGKTSAWSGGFGGTALTFEGDTLVNGFVVTKEGTFNLLRIQETGKFIVFEVQER